MNLCIGLKFGFDKIIIFYAISISYITLQANLAIYYYVWHDCPHVQLKR